MGAKYKLIYKTALPVTSIGNNTFYMDCPWQIQQGDTIGLHTTSNGESGIAMCQEPIHGTIGQCAFGTYFGGATFTLYDNDLIVGNEYDLSGGKFQQRKMAIRALYD